MPEGPEVLEPAPDEGVLLPALEPFVDESLSRRIESEFESGFESRSEARSLPAPVVPVGASAELRPIDDPPVLLVPTLLPPMPLVPPPVVPLLIPAPPPAAPALPPAPPPAPPPPCAKAAPAVSATIAVAMSRCFMLRPSSSCRVSASSPSNTVACRRLPWAMKSLCPQPAPPFFTSLSASSSTGLSRGVSPLRRFCVLPPLSARPSSDDSRDARELSGFLVRSVIAFPSPPPAAPGAAAQQFIQTNHRTQSRVDD